MFSFWIPLACRQSEETMLGHSLRQETSSLFGAFNARWLSPEEVARTFIPTNQFSELVQTQSSILMGPRGCGKTTLLKMLTTPAQEYWFRVRARRSSTLRLRFPRPDFEAVYIPSDIRWSYELQAVTRALGSNAVLAERAQRGMVCLSSLVELLLVFERLALGTARLDSKLAMALIDDWAWAPTLPSISRLRMGLESAAAKIRASLVKRDQASIAESIDSLPPAVAGHPLDALISACHVFDAEAAARLRPVRWALCFDELEIAPSWLHADLLPALRSVDQRMLLKLTWSPVLPSSMVTMQQPRADYAPIRTWYSHIIDATAFCQEFATALIRDRFSSQSLTPADVFGRSLFAAEERLGHDDDVYSEGSAAWKTFVELAKRDSTFADFMKSHGFDPANPITDSTRERDQLLRKLKPLALLRETFLGANRARSRKRPALYAGEEAIYAMSDGNPRWLAGILNEVLDANPVQRDEGQRPLIQLSKQAPILAAASQRMRQYIRLYPTSPDDAQHSGLDLNGLVFALGSFLRSQLLGQQFQGDPPGSFFVDPETPAPIQRLIERGLLIGALIYVGKSQTEVAPSLVHSRIRLSFMLAPSFQLLFRNYRPIHVTHALSAPRDSRQQDLGFPEDKAT